METIRNIQLSMGTILALTAFIYLAWIGFSIRRGRRRMVWQFSWIRMVSIALPVIILARWWLLWHTDTLFTRILHRHPCCGYAITVWMLTWIIVTFTPKFKKQSTPMTVDPTVSA